MKPFALVPFTRSLVHRLFSIHKMALLLIFISASTQAADFSSSSPPTAYIVSNCAIIPAQNKVYILSDCTEYTDPDTEQKCRLCKGRDSASGITVQFYWCADGTGGTYRGTSHSGTQTNIIVIE